MSNIIKVIDQDIVFLSYDEPNAEKNYADLLKKVPWAKRVHGVKGSDAAHKACARASDTEYFVTVDADNIIDQQFLKLEIDLDALELTSDHVFSWCGKNNVNGLMYGNGGLKMWTKQFVNNMRTHENVLDGDVKGQVEFCFNDKYYQFPECYSESFTNESPFQAWRAGFREGVKMCLNQGEKVTDLHTIWWQNYHRLLVWCNVGRDVNNGIWSILGAREGCFKTMCTDWDYSHVRDFDWLTDYYNTNVSMMDAESEANIYGNKIRDLCKLEITELDPIGSTFVKTIYNNSPRRLGKIHNV
jgi:hypothetical protein